MVREAAVGGARIRHLDDNFVPVLDAFLDSVEPVASEGASVCVSLEGHTVLEATVGDYVDDSVQVIRSVSKAVVAILALVVHERQLLNLDAPVREVWPEFGVNGKGSVSTRAILTHQAGLPVIDQPLELHDLLDWTPPVRALQAQPLRWKPGEAVGYHDLTLGWLVGEVLRRVTGSTPGELVREILADPLGLDLWIGTPREVHSRIVALVRDRTKGARSTIRLGPWDFSVEDLLIVEHTPEYLEAQVPSANGVSDARSLCRLFTALLDGTTLLSRESLADAVRVRAEGDDVMVGWPRRYATGFMLPDPTRPMGGEGTGTFGHYGFGGCLAFAQPDLGLSVAYLTRRDRSYPGVDPRTSRLAAAALACATRRAS